VKEDIGKNFYIKIANKIIIYINSIHMRDDLSCIYTLAMSDAMENIFLGGIHFKDIKIPDVEAEIQYKCLEPLADKANKNGNIDRCLAIKLILLRKLAKIYPEINFIYIAWLNKCFPEFKEHEKIKHSKKYIYSYAYALKQLDAPSEKLEEFLESLK
jgi:hypothetical protein